MSNLTDWKEILAGWEDDLKAARDDFWYHHAGADKARTLISERTDKVCELRERIAQLEKEEANAC